MKKIAVFLMLVALLVTMPASARFNAAKSDAKKVHVGLRAGVGSSGYYNIDDRDYEAYGLVTPVGGVFADFKVAKLPLYLETGAYYQNMGSKIREWYGYSYYNRYHDRYHSHRSNRDSYKLNNHSVLVPLVLSYHLYASDQIVIQPFTGFFGSYGFTSEEVDFGLREGIGVSFGHLNISFGVNIGVLDQKHHTDQLWVEDAHHVSAFFGLGVNF